MAILSGAEWEPGGKNRSLRVDSGEQLSQAQFYGKGQGGVGGGGDFSVVSAPFFSRRKTK
jgi:hypothetical protein